MVPSVQAGDHLLYEPWPRRRAQRGRRRRACDDFCSVGAVVIANHPYKELVLVKRVGRVEGDRVWLASDSPVGEDSRKFGPVQLCAVRGRVRACVGRSSWIDLRPWGQLGSRVG